MLETALKYIKTSSVIPVGRDKIPLLQTWKEFQTRKPTEQEVRDWWAKWPDANIGIVTGKISNIIVVDVEKGGAWEHFPVTTTVETGGGGVHLYYTYTPFSNKTRVFPLTDIRGDGGYVVAPPSIHKSGNSYKVIKSYAKHALFPREMFGIESETDWKEVGQGVGEGSRNDAASKMVGKLLRAFTPDDWEVVVWPMVKDWNHHNTPPLGERELRSVFQSIANRAANHLPLTPDEPIEIKIRTMTEVVEMGEAELLDTKPEDIVSFGYDWLDNQLTGLFKSELVVVGGETGTGKTAFVTNIAYKATKTKRVTVFALEDRLPTYGLNAQYFKVGEVRRRAGLLQYPWNDYRKNAITDPNFKTYLAQAKEELKNDNLGFVETNQRMTIEALEKTVEEQLLAGTQLFVVDHLHYFDLLRGDSTKADYIESLMVRLKSLLNRTGARMILVVHYRKTNGAKPTLDSFKDSISIVQNANYVINIWRDRSVASDLVSTQFSIPKSRNPNGEATIEVNWDRDTNDYKAIEVWIPGAPQAVESTNHQQDIFS